MRHNRRRGAVPPAASGGAGPYSPAFRPGPGLPRGARRGRAGRLPRGPRPGRAAGGPALRRGGEVASGVPFPAARPVECIEQQLGPGPGREYVTPAGEPQTSSVPTAKLVRMPPWAERDFGLGPDCPEALVKRCLSREPAAAGTTPDGLH